MTLALDILFACLPGLLFGGAVIGAGMMMKKKQPERNHNGR